MEKLRFAPLVRVSGERQERQGESLTTQRKQIEGYVKALGGTIPKSCWRYSGQEHATPDQERENLDQLLEDSGKGLFDAVIVCDASRWSRDNAKSKAGLEILKKNGIKFFSGTTEFDLFLPQDKLFLGMATEINEFVALEQSRKSMINRIERAKRNIPSGGKLPVGRTYDRVTDTWGIDKEKQVKIEMGVDRYLAGERMDKVAKMIGYNSTHVYELFQRGLGDTTVLHFHSERFAIDEHVTLHIPPLVPKEKIDAVIRRIEDNKTYQRGRAVNKYLLGRMILCGKCGFAAHGQSRGGGGGKKRKYYRHQRQRFDVKCNCRNWCCLPAKELDEAVMVYLFRMFGDVSGMEKAMNRAIPDAGKIEKLREQQAMLQKGLDKAEAKRQRVVESIAEGVISGDDARRAMQKIRETEGVLREELELIGPQVEKVPSHDQMQRRAKLIHRTLAGVYSRPGRLEKMSFDEKRKLLLQVFSGRDAQGKRLGVYLHKVDDVFHFTIKGGLGIDVAGTLPMSEREAERILEGELSLLGESLRPL